MCVCVCMCVCVWVGNEKGIRTEGGWSASLVRPAPLISMHFHLSRDHRYVAHRGFVLFTHITSSESSVWCVGYYYPTNYRTELILKITVRDGVLYSHTYLSWYIHIRNLCCICLHIQYAYCIAKSYVWNASQIYISHCSCGCGVLNYLFDSGHQESFPIIHHELHVSASLNSRHAVHS